MKNFIVVLAIAAFLFLQGYWLSPAIAGGCAAKAERKCTAGTCCVKGDCKCATAQCCSNGQCACGTATDCKACKCS